MAQDPAPRDSNRAPRPRTSNRPHERRTPTAADLVATGRVTPQQAYAASIVLARLHDRHIGLSMTLEEMCEVLGYLGDGRRPEAVPPDQVVPPNLRHEANRRTGRRPSPPLPPSDISA